MSAPTARGLSPRVRGYRCAAILCPPSGRCIPACAGIPSGGETVPRKCTGVSPRVRGNLCVIMTHFRTNIVKDRRPMTIRRPCDESGALQLARPAALDDANPVRPCVPGSRRKGAYATRRRRAACRACGASAGAVRRDRPHVQSSRAFFRSQGGRLPTKEEIDAASTNRTSDGLILRVAGRVFEYNRLGVQEAE